MDIKQGRKAIYEAAKKLSNWGRWGKDDQIGTLNHVTPTEVVAAGKLIRKGRIFSLGIPLNAQGPQRGGDGRWNPIHTMLATGTDAASGTQDAWNKCRYADDAINMPVQCATHWDALGHVFLDDKQYNGHPATLADSRGLQINDITASRDRMAGRGVLLDVARHRQLDSLPDGYGISNAELGEVAAAQKVEIRKGDFLLVRTGHMERCRAAGGWGTYAAGDAPGLKFESCYWLQDKQVAAVCTDTWGVEVRPNETDEANQPWHWVVIPAMGLTMGEIFDLSKLAADCAEDKVYEFFFCAPPLVITGGTGSPINPYAIK